MAALQWVTVIFESIFIQVVIQQLEEDKTNDAGTLSPNALEQSFTASGSLQRMPRHRTRTSTNLPNLGSSPELPESGMLQSASTGNLERIRRAASSSSLNSIGRRIKIFSFFLQYFYVIF